MKQQVQATKTSKKNSKNNNGNPDAYPREGIVVLQDTKCKIFTDTFVPVEHWNFIFVVLSHLQIYFLRTPLQSKQQLLKKQ